MALLKTRGAHSRQRLARSTGNVLPGAAATFLGLTPDGRRPIGPPRRAVCRLLDGVAGSSTMHRTIERAQILGALVGEEARGRRLAVVLWPVLAVEVAGLVGTFTFADTAV
ncbi:hypothetical protein AB0O18_34005, partial [Streptomyces sp. NPDC093224]|uniref:hypothetical protein n=1 Tax=Streptomyces sp. NPDC093224 TaxID=3155198 RepID=UPI0034467BA9